MPTQEKTAEEVAQDLLANEEKISGATVTYTVDAEKLSEYGYKAIADRLNEFFGVIVVDISDGGVGEKMFLDSALGIFLTRDDEKVDILP